MKSAVYLGIYKEGLKRFKNKKVLVKLHMGEKGNKTHLRPSFVKSIVEMLKEIKAKPFLFDTTASYTGGRDTKEKYLKTAKENGFSEKTIGCKIRIGNAGKKHTIEGLDFFVAKEVANTKCLLTLSHGKGHFSAGFGGCIKNWGMGGVDKKTKYKIHKMSQPKINKKKCTLCKTCEESCPSKCITTSNKWELDYNCCWGCGRCTTSCPRGALSFKIKNMKESLALAAHACLAKKNHYHINVLKRITKHCDCTANPGPIICPDIGILSSEDPVAIDQASIDLIEKKAKRTFKQMIGTDPRPQLKEGERIELGTMSYELKKLPLEHDKKI